MCVYAWVCVMWVKRTKVWARGEWSKESQLSWKYYECVWVGVQTHTYVCICIYIYVYAHTCVVYCACVCVSIFVRPFDLRQQQPPKVQVQRSCSSSQKPPCRVARLSHSHMLLVVVLLLMFFFCQPKRGWHCSWYLTLRRTKLTDARVCVCVCP